MSPIFEKSVSFGVIKQVNLFVLFTWLAWIIKETELVLILVDTDTDIHLPLLRKCEHSGFHSENSFLVVSESTPVCVDLVHYTLFILNFVMAELLEWDRKIAPRPIVVFLLGAAR